MLDAEWLAQAGGLFVKRRAPRRSSRKSPYTITHEPSTLIPKRPALPPSWISPPQACSDSEGNPLKLAILSSCQALGSLAGKEPEASEARVEAYCHLAALASDPRFLLQGYLAQ
jgi:hypothetical protein